MLNSIQYTSGLILKNKIDIMGGAIMSNIKSVSTKTDTNTSARRKFLKLGGLVAAGTAATVAFPQVSRAATKTL